MRSTTEYIIFFIILISVANGQIPESSFVFADFTNTTNLQPVSVSISNSIVQLTPYDAGQTGAIWYINPIYIAGFSVQFTFQMNPNSNPLYAGMDGIAFVVQNLGNDVLGPMDAGIGYGDYQSGTTLGIRKSIAFEFDTYKDSAPVNDPSNNHISVHYNPNGPNSAFESFSLFNYSGFPKMNNGTQHTANITFTPTNFALTLDGFTIPIQNKVSLTNLLQSPTAYIGFTSSTGRSGGDEHLLLSWNYQYNGVITAANCVLFGQQTAKAGVLASLFFQARDQYQNNVTADSSVVQFSLTGPDTAYLANVTALGQGLFQLQYQASAAGTYQIRIQIDNGTFPAGSTLTINPAAVAGNATTAGMIGVTNAGDVASFTVTPADRFGNVIKSGVSVTAQIVLNATVSVATTVNQNTNTGIVTVTFTPTIAGNYTVLVNVGVPAQPIVGSPFALQVLVNSLSPSNCLVQGQSTIAAGSNVSFTIVARDKVNNVIPTVFPVTALLKSFGLSSISLSVSPASTPGYYTATGQVTVASIFTLSVSINSQSLTTTPMLTVTNGVPSANQSRVINAAPNLNSTAGKLSAVQFQAADQYNNSAVVGSPFNFSVSISGPSGFRPNFTLANSAATYTVSFNSTVSGMHSINISYLGNPIVGSPVSYLILPAVTLPRNCFLTDFPVNRSVGDREVLGFVIHALDRYNNSQVGSADNFTVFATKLNASVSQRLNWTFTINPSGQNDGTYGVSFGPVPKGTFSIYVRLQGNDIAGSPFTLHARFGFSRMQYIYIGLGAVGVVLILFVVFLVYRRFYLPAERRRDYERLRNDNNTTGQPSV